MNKSFPLCLDLVILRRFLGLSRGWVGKGPCLECTYSPGASRHLETPGGWAVGQKEQLETKGQVVKERQGVESRSMSSNVHNDPSFPSRSLPPLMPGSS